MLKDKFYFLSVKSIVLTTDLSFLSKCPFLDLSFLHSFLNHPLSHFLSHLPYVLQQQEQHPFLWHSSFLQFASQQQQSLPANVAAAPPTKPSENIPTFNSFITNLLYKTRRAFATERWNYCRIARIYWYRRMVFAHFSAIFAKKLFSDTQMPRKKTHEVTDDKRKFLVSDIKNKKTRKHPLRFSSKAEKPSSKIHLFKHFECFEGNLNHPYPLIPIKNSTLLRVFFTRSNTISMALLAGTTPFKARRRM